MNIIYCHRPRCDVSNWVGSDATLQEINDLIFEIEMSDGEACVTAEDILSYDA